MIQIPLTTRQNRPTVVLLLTAGCHGSHLLIGQVVRWQKERRVKERQRETVERDRDRD